MPIGKNERMEQNKSFFQVADFVGKLFTVLVGLIPQLDCFNPLRCPKTWSIGFSRPGHLHLVSEIGMKEPLGHVRLFVQFHLYAMTMLALS